MTESTEAVTLHASRPPFLSGLTSPDTLRVSSRKSLDSEVLLNLTVARCFLPRSPSSALPWRTISLAVGTNPLPERYFDLGKHSETYTTSVGHHADESVDYDIDIVVFRGQWPPYFDHWGLRHPPRGPGRWRGSPRHGSVVRHDVRVHDRRGSAKPANTVTLNGWVPSRGKTLGRSARSWKGCPPRARPGRPRTRRTARIGWWRASRR